MLSGRRIGLLTASASRLGGGVAEAVAAQAAIVRALSGEPLVFALDDAHAQEARVALAPAPVMLARVAGPPQIGFAPMQLRQLLEAELDLLHLHGIWMHPSRVGRKWAAATGRPYVISPHGMLDPWITARGRWKKALARHGYERASWAQARLLHALTEREAADIARESGRAAIIIPNAGPAAARPPAELRPPHVLYLGRIHPKKNLAGLIAGWRTARLPPGAKLRIAGWGDDDDVAELRRLLDGPDDTVSFLGAVYGMEKQRLLGEARFLVLPSFSEGLPMVVLEAWAAATPTLHSAGCNLPEGFAAQLPAARPCGTEPGQIAAALEAALAMDAPHWLAMAEAARALAAGPFSHRSVATRWAQAYAALLDTPARGARPGRS